MNCSSVRNSPTPSAPVSSSIGRSATRPELWQQRDRDAVAGDRRLVLELAVMRAAPCADAAPCRHRPARRSASAADARCPPAPSTMMSSPFSLIETMFSACPTATRPSERATIATWLIAAALLEHDRRAAACGRIRAARPAPCCGRRGWRSRAAPCARSALPSPVRTRSSRLARSSRSCSRSRI